MTREQIEAEVTRLQELLGLTQWRVRVTADNFEGVVTDGEPEVGNLSRYEFALTADLKIATKRNDPEILETVRHELCHLLLGDLADVFEDATRQLGLQANKVSEEAWQRVEEQTVTRLTRAIARLVDQWEEEGAE